MEPVNVSATDGPGRPEHVNVVFMPVIVGSVRKNRRTYHPAKLVSERVVAAGHRTELIDLRALNLPMYDEEEASETHPGVLEFKEIMARSDATIWCTPEYNHSFTSAVKNAIDYVGDEIRRKPAAVCGLAGGALGGSRAVEQLKLVLIELHSLPIRDSVYFSEARTLFDADGKLLKPNFISRIDHMLAELAWYAGALAWGRQKLPVPARARG